jgi:hypothetical protein
MVKTGGMWLHELHGCTAANAVNVFFGACVLEPTPYWQGAPMEHRRLLAILALLLGCSAAPYRVAGPVIDAAGKVESARLVDPYSKQELAQFTRQEVAELNAILGRAEESAGYSATTPPWDAAIVMKTSGGTEVIVHFAAPGLRFSRHTPWLNGANVTDPAWEAASVDFDLTYEDSDWFWGVLGGYLGGTKVKEYHTPKMGFDVGPKKGGK